MSYKWPSNTWPKDKKLKELGLWGLENVSGGLEGLSLALFTRVLGWTKEEVLALLPGIRRDMRNKNYHNYLPV